MKTAICYYSRHHGNTRKVLEAMAQVGEVELIDVTVRQAVHLEDYDCIGFASGIYYGRFHNSVLHFAEQYLPKGKRVFFVCTYGARRRSYTRAISQVVQAKDCRVLGEFGCRGHDTFGPLQLFGGVAKRHPDERDLKQAGDFYSGIIQT